jgi:hypothetical protein
MPLRDRGRDDLIEEVKFGRMTPAEAEAEAKRLGLAPLASQPDANKYTPMDEGWWSLAMTVAWIASRNPQKVLEAYDPYRAECFDWHYRKWRIGFDGPIYAGHFLGVRPPATLPGMSLAEIFDTPTDGVKLVAGHRHIDGRSPSENHT